jgi:hypothetical protein
VGLTLKVFSIKNELNLNPKTKQNLPQSSLNAQVDALTVVQQVRCATVSFRICVAGCVARDFDSLTTFLTPNNAW